MEPERRKNGTRPNRRAPRLETLEGRELLSGLGGGLVHQGLHPRLVHVLQASSGGTSGSSNPSGGSGGSGGSQVASFQVPTPQAAAQSRYDVVFRGYYVIAPPQFQDQLARTVVNANAPSWEPHHQLFLSFNYATPNDGSSVSPVSITIQGPHPGGSDQLVLNGTIQPASPNQVLPTQMTWTVNQEGFQSTGIFGGAQGQGTAELIYGPARGGARARVGSVRVVIQGIVVRTNLPGS